MAGRCRPASTADARRSWGLATVSRGGLTVELMLREVEGVVPQAEQAIFGTRRETDGDGGLVIGVRVALHDCVGKGTEEGGQLRS